MAEKTGWETSETARRYLEMADVLIPCRRDILYAIAKLTAEFTPENPVILDIGCGNGDVTNEILSLKPSVSLSLLDYSDDMIKMATERFSNNSNIKVLKHNLNNGLPEQMMAVKFDAVVSCFALHHIELENRVRLYENIRQVLREGGLFINGDRFIVESPSINQWGNDFWIAWVVERIRTELGIERTFEEVKQAQVESDKQHGDKPGTIWEMREDLKRAGFKFVDCIWMQYNLCLGIIVASKTSAKRKQTPSKEVSTHAIS